MKKCNIFWVFIFIILASCQSELDKYYEIPDWLKGNAYEVLQKEKRFTLFLQAIDRSDFKDLVNGKGIATVMAPTDEAFEAYLKKHGLNSIDDLSQTELNKLVGFHVVYYSYSKNDFMNYKPDGVDSELKYPGIYYKFRTKSRDAISTGVDLAKNGAIRKIMHKERFLPVFSANFFKSYAAADAAAEYKQLYPDSEWTGDDGFNVSNASVLEYQIVTDNGYLYVIDQVLEPLETIFTELANSEEYSDFAKIYDRFISYEYDADATKDYGNGDSLFVHSHIELPPIASEWTTYAYTTVPDYAQMAYLTSLSYNIVAPDNNSLQNFFQKYWAKYYESLDDVNYYPLYRLVNIHVNNSDFLLPSYVPLYINSYDWVDGQKNTELGLTKICVNGVLYGMKNNIITPSIFESPAALALTDPDYNMMMIMMQKSTYINYLGQYDATGFNVFYPSDNMLVRNSSYEGGVMRYLRGNRYTFQAETIELEGADGFAVMTTNQMRGFVGAHMSDRIIAGRTHNGENELVYATLNDYEYLYRVGDKIYSSSIWNNQEIVEVPELEEVGNYFSGTAYKLTGEDKGAFALSPEVLSFTELVGSPDSPEIFNGGFSTYLGLTDVSTTVPPFDFLQGERFIIFVPTIEAVREDRGGAQNFPRDIMEYDIEVRNNYIKAMYVNVSGSLLYDYPFPGAMTREETTLKTFYKVRENGELVETTITLIDNGDELVVRDRKGNEAKVVDYFPYIYADGAVYMIDGVLDLLDLHEGK